MNFFSFILPAWDFICSYSGQVLFSQSGEKATFSSCKMYARLMWTLTLSFSNLMPLVCIWFLRDCGPARMHALPGWPGWQAIAQDGEVGVSAHQQRLCVPGWSGRVPWKLYFIRLKILTSEAFNSDSPKEGGAQTPHLGLGWLIEPRCLRCCVLIHPECHLGLWVLSVQDVTSVEESLLPTFAYLYSGAVPSPPLLCLCSINLQNRAWLVISPWSLFLLISLQNRSTWTLLFQSLMCSPCQAVV